MAIDLAKDGEFEVTVADINSAALAELKNQYSINTIESDLSNSDNINKIIRDFDIVLSAVPGHMGFQTLKTIIKAGKNVIDIAFFPENLFDLNDLAQKKGVIVISDIGVAPGMSNVLIGLKIYVKKPFISK